MRTYLDLCCLKRPFDRQDAVRVRLESEAVLALMTAPPRDTTLLRAPAHELENAQNPLQWRREAIAEWLAAGPLLEPDEALVTERIAKLMAAGFGGFDAFHVASAEALDADCFVTCDDLLLRRAERLRPALSLRVLSPVTLAREVFR